VPKQTKRTTIETPDFDTIRHVEEDGTEEWSARELMKLLGYNRWENFQVVIRKAMSACEQSGLLIENHFREITREVSLGSQARRDVKDNIISRYACYLIAQNGDSRKPQIAAAQTYFALATRRDELRRQKFIELDGTTAAGLAKRLEIREYIDQSEKLLAETAQQAGVSPENFGQFQDAGYKGLYGGLDRAAIKQRKTVSPEEDLLDRMGVEELASNLFRSAQATKKLQRDEIIGENIAIETHFAVGEEVRGAITRLGGDMPEKLPAEPSLRPILEQKKKQTETLLPEASSKNVENTEITANKKRGRPKKTEN
jgi:DNA-damage-inducible protein D